MLAILLKVSLLVLFVAIVVLGLTAVVARMHRNRRSARDDRLTAPLRPLLLRIAAGGEDAEDAEDAETAMDELNALEEKRWRLIEPNAVALLEKVRGGARQGLVELFARRGTIERARRDLRGPGTVRKARAAETLGLLGDQGALPDLCALLQDRIPEVRMVAARALGRLRNPDGAAPLLRSLAGGATPAGTVAKALVRIGPPGAPALAAALAHEDPLVRVTAAQVVGLIGPTQADGRLISMLVEEPHAEVQAMAVRSLGLLGTRAALEALRRAAGSHSPPALRAEVASALGEIGAAEAIPELRELVMDPHYPVAHQAAQALGRLGPEGHRELVALSEAPDRVAAAHAEEVLAGIRLAKDRDDLRSARVAAGRAARGSAIGRSS